MKGSVHEMQGLDPVRCFVGLVIVISIIVVAFTMGGESPEATNYAQRAWYLSTGGSP